jgi:hypothetical protein
LLIGGLSLLEKPYHIGMSARLMLWFSALMAVSVCCAQTPPATFEFRIPDQVRPQDAFIRYVITGDDFGGWINTKPGVSSYHVNIEGRRTSSIRAIFYAPGCAIEMVDIALQSTVNRQHSFACEPLATEQVDGKVQTTGWLDGRNVRIEAKYVARWAPGFLGIAKEVPLTIPLAQRAPIAADGRFQIAVPNFLRDAHSGAANGTGELQIWAVDADRGAEIAHLIPLGNANSGDRTGSLKLSAAYPNGLLFDVCSVGRQPARLIRREGFVIRDSDPAETCVH